MPEGVNFQTQARSVIMQQQNLLDAYGKAGPEREQFTVSSQHDSFAEKAFSLLTRAYDLAEYDSAIRET